MNTEEEVIEYEELELEGGIQEQDAIISEEIENIFNENMSHDMMPIDFISNSPTIEEVLPRGEQ